jgi:hypothetical protein
VCGIGRRWKRRSNVCEIGGGEMEEEIENERKRIENRCRSG